MSGSHLLRLCATLLLGCAVILGLETEAASALLAGPALATANITNGLLAFLGVETVQQGTVITQPYVFSYEIHTRCLGVLPASVFVILTLVHPAGLRSKLMGVCIVLPVLFALNITRLVHLFLVGVFQPHFFWMAHHVIWNGITFAAVVLMGLVWLKWSDNSAVAVSGMNYQQRLLSKKEDKLHWKDI